MFNIIFITIIYIILFLVLSEFEVRFKPFNITFNALGKGIGIFFIIFGIFLISMNYYIKGYKKAISNKQNIELIKK